MDTDWFFRFAFILYCATVGLLLALAPWSRGWDQMLLLLPQGGLQVLGLPILRGALSGFGLVHLVWCAHDLLSFLRPAASDHGPPHP